MSAVPPVEGLAPVRNPGAHLGAHFDVAGGGDVPSDWGTDGNFILVHATVNGSDVGWFILDTGASGCTISAEAAGQAGLKPIGRTQIQGTTPTTVFRADHLRVGPLTLTGLNMAGLNIARSRHAFGRKVAGILGRNVFSSALVLVNGPQRTVQFMAPDRAQDLADLAWMPLHNKDGLPCLECSYSGGVTGLFLLDTGADATVHFRSSAAEHIGRRSPTGVRITGTKSLMTFGTIDRVNEGTIDDFRIGSKQYGPLSVTLATPDARDGSLPIESDGLVGMGLIRSWRVLIDQIHDRVAIDPASAPLH